MGSFDAYMRTKALSVTLPLCTLLAALLLPAAAAADEVVSELARDTPIAAYGGVVAWSDYDTASRRYRLIVRQGDRSDRAPIASSRRAFDVSLGPDRRGRVVALYTRCRTATRGCDVYRYGVRARREHKLVSVSSARLDEAWPVQWRGRVAFVRRARAYVVDGYHPRPDPRGKRGGGELTDCDVPYIKTLATRAPIRRLDRGQCASTTGLSIRGERIVQVTDLNQGGAGSESQVRLLTGHGGGARVLARATGGEGGYSRFASPSQSASAVWLTRTGSREPMDFLGVDIASRRLTQVDPHLPLAGRLARDERGGFWYVQARFAKDFGEPPFCSASARGRCQLIHASASPFSSATRTLTPQLRLSPGTQRESTGLYTNPIVISGDLTRTVVRGGVIVRREPLSAEPVELRREDPPLSGHFVAAMTATTDPAGRWSFALEGLAPLENVAVRVRDIGAYVYATVDTAARVTLTASGTSLAGTVTPAQPTKSVTIQRLQADGKGKLPNGLPRCRTNAAGQRSCQDDAWINVANARLDTTGTIFSVSVQRPGVYRADLSQANYRGRSPELTVSPEHDRSLPLSTLTAAAAATAAIAFLGLRHMSRHARSGSGSRSEP